MSPEPPSTPKFENLDWSEFHPLDHKLWQCQGYPGGWTRHLKYRWDFQWRNRLASLTFCKVQKHRKVQAHSRRLGDHHRCGNCGTRLPDG